MSGNVLKKCTKCEDYRAPAAEYQNKKYGTGQRIHTVGVKLVKCTVCGESKSK